MCHQRFCYGVEEDDDQCDRGDDYTTMMMMMIEVMITVVVICNGEADATVVTTPLTHPINDRSYIARHNHYNQDSEDENDERYILCLGDQAGLALYKRDKHVIVRFVRGRGGVWGAFRGSSNSSHKSRSCNHTVLYCSILWSDGR